MQLNKITFAPETKQLLKRAATLALRFSHPYIGSEHLLAAILEQPGPNLIIFLKDQKINQNQLKQELLNLLRSTSRLPDITALFRQLEKEEKSIHLDQDFLSRFSTNLTDEKLQKNINPVIGRTKELERLIQILARKDKNNPIILGDPGVGKTALVEGLAKKILQGKVPNILLNKKILCLDLALIIAGTNYRGEFEQRLKIILDEIQQNPNIIIFIDEIHNIIGAGSTSGTLDAANILKPLLAHGELRCIGATTLEEYKKYIEPDAALARRFQPIILEEPNIEQTIEILQGIKKNYEQYHQVIFSNEALVAAAELSHQYLPDKYLPDKAIDLIDEAAARAKMQYHQKNANLQQLTKLRSQLKNLQKSKKQAVYEEKFDLALMLKNQETQIKKQIKNLVKNTKIILPQVHAKDIAQLIHQKTNIPLAELGGSVEQYISSLKKQLEQKVIGQKQVIKQIANILKRHKLGLTSWEQPIASLMFVGPSGVGKTYLAQVLAETYFHTPKALIRLDMSEFSDKINITKLIGAPAGYVGYQEGNKLADAVRRRPHSLILFDEIEKAHQDIFPLLWQILDTGEITDASGRLVNFRNTIIILTCNLGAELWQNQQSEIGFFHLSSKQAKQTQIQEKLTEQLKKHFSSNLFNRLDQTLFFQPLEHRHFKEIIKLNLADLNQRLKKRNIHLEITNQALDFLSQQIEQLGQGSRGIRKIIKQEIETLLLKTPMYQKNLVIDLNKSKNKLISTHALSH